MILPSDCELISDCEHEWEEIEVVCGACGSHDGLWCEYCGTLIDLASDDDPR
jgi:hypothetical protein